MRKRIDAYDKKPVRVSQVEFRAVKTTDLCQLWFEKL